MYTPSKRHARIFAGGLLVGILLVLVVSNLGVATGQSDRTDISDIQQQADKPLEERDKIAPPRNHTTVVSSHLNKDGELFALGPEGRVIYYDDSNTGYWDVDPSPHGDRTIMYTTAQKITDSSSGCIQDVCIKTFVEEANLTTGQTREVYSRIYPGYTDTEWHDADWINETHLLVAGIYEDRVFIVNTTSGMTVWEWEAENHYNLTEGRPYPHDWTHLNDVECLDDGRVMASLRGMDEVIFIDTGSGVEEGWTLGEEGNHSILRGQHNPDYIPPENGGPAVLVADSDNNRVVEYQRTASGAWRRSWVWQDWQLQWGRDADRLPNGNTLITDTHGNRLLEVNESGDIVWHVDIGTAYEAERLELGDESTGNAAATLGLENGTVGSGGESVSPPGPGGRFAVFIKGLLPPLVVNGLAVVFPDWAGILDILLIGVAMGIAGVWALAEFRWSEYYLRLPVGHSS